jgi:putative acyl-CoA dehydrogenase
MRNVLADMAVESEAATALGLRVARAFDEAATDPPQRPFARLVVAVAKYWINKRLPNLVVEAMECLGGAGYGEDSPLPRLYREAPVNGIWEGSGNVICLDALRTLEREPESAELFLAEVGAARGGDRRLDGAIDALEDGLARPPDEAAARRLVERLALVLQGALLVRHAPGAIADAFCASRLDGDWGRTYGSLPSGLDVEAAIERVRPGN